MVKRKKNSSLGNISANNAEAVPAKMITQCGSKSDEDLPSDWQSSRRKLPERLNFICNTEHFADIHFIVGSKDKKKFPAHKLILIVGSEVFGAMFSEKWGTQMEIEITDVEPEAFLILLKFLYSEKADLTVDSVFDVLYVAKKYAVVGLTNACASFIQNNLNALNVFTVLNHAPLFDENPEIIETSLKFIDQDTENIVLDDGFTTIDQNMLSSILRRDSLTINELDLLRGTLRWSEDECRRKKIEANSENKLLVLEGILRLIRYPLMSLTEFSSEVAEKKLLPAEDLVSLFLYFTSGRKTPVNFVTLPRSSPYLVLDRFLEVSLVSFKCNGQKNLFIINSDHDIKLRGIGVFKSITETSKYNVQLDVDLYSSLQNLVSKTWEAIDDFPRDSCRVLRLGLDTPVELKRQIPYIISFSIKGPDSFQGIKSKGPIVVKLPGISNKEIRFNIWNNLSGNFQDASTSGQLPELLFSL